MTRQVSLLHIFAVISVLLTSQLVQAAEELVSIGVLTHRGKEPTLAAWSPTAFSISTSSSEKPVLSCLLVTLITPMMSYFALIVAFTERYRKDAGIGTRDLGRIEVVGAPIERLRFPFRRYQ